MELERENMRHPRNISRIRTAGIVVLVLVVSPFVLHAVGSGWSGIALQPVPDSRFFLVDRLVTNAGLAAHMILGGLLTLLVPLQIWQLPRQHWPRLHRALGYVLLGCASATSVGGMVYILARGTIGGAAMNVGFALYGILLLGAALQAVRFARARDFIRHRRWALRFFVLCLGSWLYRVHYGLWYAATGGIGSTPAFDGAFDLVQNFAFYLPYLLLLELWFRFETKPRQGARSTQTSL